MCVPQDTPLYSSGSKVPARANMESMPFGNDEESQRRRFETLMSPGYWPTPFDPDVAGSGGLFGHNTYNENNPGAQWVRWELALVDHEIDSGVDYVPGSHNRWRSDFENEISLSRQLSEQALADIPDIKGVKPTGMTAAAMSDGESGESLMPGGGIVQIKAGQTVFWNGDGFHRGRSREGKERISLACGWAGPPPQGWENVNKDMTPRQSLHHWKLNPIFRDALPSEWMKKSLDRWLLTQGYTEYDPTFYDSL